MRLYTIFFLYMTRWKCVSTKRLLKFSVFLLFFSIRTQEQKIIDFNCSGIPPPPFLAVFFIFVCLILYRSYFIRILIKPPTYYIVIVKEKEIIDRIVYLHNLKILYYWREAPLAEG